ncbi:hypothetical protein ACGFI9_04375 [Micromonospora sp. NPDC048930]|uniref:hypothetical protein n=1 Tax=Micromonospora sp. NPDC048930 TaxID=3364261 RepID=UPI00371F8BB8
MSNSAEALTASVLAGALMAVPVGRWLDRHGGGALMTTGSITATVLLIAWSQVQTIGQLYAVMIGIGITGAMVLYEPAFAVIVSWFTPRPTLHPRLAAPVTTAKASAPLAAAVVRNHGGYPLVLAAVTSACLLASAGMLAMRGGVTPSGGKPGEQAS